MHTYYFTLADKSALSTHPNNRHFSVVNGSASIGIISTLMMVSKRVWVQNSKDNSWREVKAEQVPVEEHTPELVLCKISAIAIDPGVTVRIA